MSLDDDARLVVETVGKLRQAPGPLSVLPDGYDEACLRLAKAVLDADEAVDGGCEFCGAAAKPDFDDVAMTCGSWWDVFDGWVRSKECIDRQIAHLTAKLAEESERRSETVAMCSQLQSELADHQQRLMRQSAELNAVRQERDELKRKTGAE